MEKEKMQLLLKKFKTNDEMRQFMYENANQLQVGEANNILRTLSKIDDGENSFADVIKKGAKLKGVPKIKNAELYQDVIEDLETQRGIAEFSGNTKLANKLQEEKWDVLESAEKEDVGIYLKKYYPKGYNLLAKTLNTLEKSERSCYDGCIHKLVNEKNLSTIVRALENLAQVDPEVNSLVDKNLDTNNTFRIPTINGMPIGGYGIIGDRVKNAVKDINDFFKKSGEILKDRISGTSKDGFYQSAKSSANIDSGFGQSVNDKFMRQSQNSMGDSGFVKMLPKANFDDNGFNDQTTQENSNSDYGFSQRVKVEQNELQDFYKQPTVVTQKNEFVDTIKKNIGNGYDNIKSVLDNTLNWGAKSLAIGSKLPFNSLFMPKLNMVSSILSDDLMSFDINNTDIEKINKAKYISSYKGKLIIKNDIHNLAKNLFGEKVDVGSSFAFGDYIFLNNKLTKLDDIEKTVKHEYGHTKQYENLGFEEYIKYVAIPSVNGYKQGLYGEQYYLQPWERSADVLGGNGNVHVGDSDTSNIDPVGEVSNMANWYTRLTNLFKNLDSWSEIS